MRGRTSAFSCSCSSSYQGAKDLFLRAKTVPVHLEWNATATRNLTSTSQIWIFTDFHRSFYYYFLRKYQAKWNSRNSWTNNVSPRSPCPSRVRVSVYVCSACADHLHTVQRALRDPPVTCEDASKLFRISPITYNIILHSVPYIHRGCVQWIENKGNLIYSSPSRCCLFLDHRSYPPLSSQPLINIFLSPAI